MVRSAATTVKDYLAELTPERRKAIEAVRSVILQHLPQGYTEVMQYGMIGYVVPLSLYPAGYLDDDTVPLPFVGLAAQKNYMAVYLMNIYGDKADGAWFLKAYKKSGKKMNMGKSCVRFRKLEDLPLDLIGQAVARTPVRQFIKRYEARRSARR